VRSSDAELSGSSADRRPPRNFTTLELKIPSGLTTNIHAETIKSFTACTIAAILAPMRRTSSETHEEHLLRDCEGSRKHLLSR